MYLFKKISTLRQFLEHYRNKNRLIGFVPTMGALHEGHLSLVRQSLETTQCTVCSIFVNPTQFNESTDLEKYPRTPAKDLTMLYEVGCHAVFMPSAEEVYPPGLDTSVNLDFGALAQPMEGRFRPGHFHGVAQVVKRLLDIVEPGRLFMGQKDYQQFLIIRYMAEALSLPTEVVMCPIVREKNGLAMSSRNQRLSPEQREQAAALYQALRHASRWAEEFPPREVERKALEQLHQPGLEPEYFQLVDGNTLQPVEDYESPASIIACAALWTGGVRLIDNLILKG
ncbi:MAG: pantoate--beta-alanine ligase [Phaeodactylibacter sp.]|nr:pantoate--beta-alanine ligase [Phaeodactylibacter sp.]MCB9266621.1 pantoate--beta-alanine ligase [Lewinellaceae bacterium]MCB9290294.1 pantoate--beta-alanine ligase [Lewinellaceae bacterium]